MTSFAREHIHDHVSDMHVQWDLSIKDTLVPYFQSMIFSKTVLYIIYTYVVTIVRKLYSGLI